jgi:hypothetical protein
MGGDGRRTFLVVGDDIDLFAALRAELDGAMLLVQWATVAACQQSVADCRPWPWAICGVSANIDRGSMHQTLRRPVLWFWNGASPTWLPAHHRSFASWRDLLADVRRCLNRSVGGVRLAPNRGLVGPGSELILSPALEGLVGGCPAPVTISARARGSVARILDRYALPLALVTEIAGTRLEATA